MNCAGLFRGSGAHRQVYVVRQDKEHSRLLRQLLHCFLTAAAADEAATTASGPLEPARRSVSRWGRHRPSIQLLAGAEVVGRPHGAPCAPAPNRQLTSSAAERSRGGGGSRVGGGGYQERARRCDGPFLEWLSGCVLLSHTVTSAVPSALKGLASGFGMEPGVSPSL